MELICIALTVYLMILFVRVVLSWVTMFWSPPAALSPAVRVVYDLTEPVLSFLRRYIPPVGGLDLTPLVIIIALQLVLAQLC